MSLSSSSDLPVLGGQAGLHPHPSCDGIKGHMSLSPFTHYHEEVGDTHPKSSCAPCSLGHVTLGQPAHSTRAFSGCLGSWQHRGERSVISILCSPLQERFNQRPCFSHVMASPLEAEENVNKGFCEAMGKVLAAPTSPAVIVFPQAQLKSIRYLGIIWFLKDTSRVPGQAGPIHEVSVGLPSVRVTISLIAGFRCIFGRM